MSEYTVDELQGMVEWQYDQLEQQSTVLNHLQEVIALWVKEGAELDELYDQCFPGVPEEDQLIYRLNKRAEIRRQIDTRKSVQEGKPDRIADLLEEAARTLQMLKEGLEKANG